VVGVKVCSFRPVLRKRIRCLTCEFSSARIEETPVCSYLIGESLQVKVFEGPLPPTVTLQREHLPRLLAEAVLTGRGRVG
jgi:hypothetical protein